MPSAASDDLLIHIRDIYMTDSRPDPPPPTKIPATCDAIDIVISREAKKTQNAVDALEDTVTAAEEAMRQLQPRILVSTAAAWAKTAEVAAEAHRQARTMHEHNHRMHQAQEQATEHKNESEAHIANLQHKVAQMTIENYQIRRKMKQNESENKLLHERCRELCLEREAWEAKQHLHTAQLKKLFQRIDELRKTTDTDPNTSIEAGASYLTAMEKTVARLNCLLVLTDISSKAHRRHIRRVLKRFVASGGQRRAVDMKRRAWQAWRGEQGAARKVLTQVVDAGARRRAMTRAWKAWRGKQGAARKVLTQVVDVGARRRAMNQAWKAWRSKQGAARKVLTQEVARHKCRRAMNHAWQAWCDEHLKWKLFWRDLSVRVVTRAPRAHTRQLRRMLGWHRHYVRARQGLVFSQWQEASTARRAQVRRSSLASRRVKWLRAKHAWRAWCEDYAYSAQRTAQLAMLIFRQAILQVCSVLGFVAPISDAETVAWYYEAALETQACVGMHLSAQCTAILHQRLCVLGMQSGLAFDAAHRVLRWAQGVDLLVMVKRVVAIVYGEYGHVCRAVLAVGMQDALNGV